MEKSKIIDTLETYQEPGLIGMIDYSYQQGIPSFPGAHSRRTPNLSLSTIDPSCVPCIISYFRKFSYVIANKVDMSLTFHVLLLAYAQPFHLKLGLDWSVRTQKRRKRKTIEIEMSCSMNSLDPYRKKKFT